jgi:hypothetical protein
MDRGHTLADHRTAKPDALYVDADYHNGRSDQSRRRRTAALLHGGRRKRRIQDGFGELQILARIHTDAKARSVNKLLLCSLMSVDVEPIFAQSVCLAKCASRSGNCNNGEVRGANMQTFQVQIWPEGMSPEAYQVVEADTEKEAAEKLYGKPLREEGFLHQLRAIVRTSDGTGTTASFYELRRPLWPQSQAH